MLRETGRVDIAEIEENPRGLRALVEDVRRTRQPRVIQTDGEDAVIMSPAKPSRVRRRSKPITEDDPLWRLVGSATDAPPTDSSRKREYLAQANWPEQP